MRLLERIGTAWSALTAKAAPPAGGSSSGWGGGPFWSDAFRSRRAPSPAELADAYKSIVYACANLNAYAVARAPLRLYALTKGGQARPKCAVKAVARRAKDRLGRLDYAAKAIAGAEHVEEVTTHPLLDAVTKVNDDLDHAQLLAYTALSLDVVGSAYWWPAIGRLGIPEEIWALPPHLVSPVFSSGSMVPDSYTFGGISYPKDQLVRFRRLSAKNPYGQGYGPAQAAIEYARLEDTFVSLQDNLLSNGPRPSVLVSPKDPKATFGPAERQRLEADMERRGRGGRAGSVFVVDGAAAVTPLSYSPTDLGGLQVSSYDLERIANCFDVPVSMLKTEDVNRANAEAGLEQHARNAVEPRCRLIASTLTRWTHSLDRKGARGWDRLFWAFDPVVAEDKRAEAELHKTYLDLGVISRNEVRLDLGYGSADGGDALLVPSSLARLADIAGESEEAPDLDEEPETESEGGASIGDEESKAISGLAREDWSEVGDRLADFGSSGNVLHRGKRPHRNGPRDGRPAARKPRVRKPAVRKPRVRKPGGNRRSSGNCGTGAGGFKPGNTCQSGGHGGSAEETGRKPRGSKPEATQERDPKNPKAPEPKRRRKPKPDATTATGNGGAEGANRGARGGQGPSEGGRTPENPGGSGTGSHGHAPTIGVHTSQGINYDTGRVPGPNPNDLRQRLVSEPTAGEGGVYIKPQNGRTKVGSTDDFRGRYGPDAPDAIQVEIPQTKFGPPEGVDDSAYPWNPKYQRRFDEEYVDRLIHEDARYRKPGEPRSPVSWTKWRKFRHIFGYGNVKVDFGKSPPAPRKRRGKGWASTLPGAWIDSMPRQTEKVRRIRDSIPPHTHQERRTMEELLRRLLNRLDVIGRDHSELYDTECRDRTGDAVFDGFVRPREGYTLPDDFALYTPEANRAVKEALAEYIDAAKAKAAELGLDTFHDRLEAYQLEDVKSDVDGSYYDDFFGYAHPDEYDDDGNYIG